MTVLEEDPSRGRLVVEARRDGALLGAVTLNAASVHREYQRRLADCVQAMCESVLARAA